MTTWPVPVLSDPRGRMIGFRLPTREEWRTMIQAHPVLVAFLAFLAAVVLVAALGAIVYLAMHDKGTEAVGGLLVGLLGVVLARLGRIAKQTDGTTTKLVDAVIASPPVSNVDVSSVDGPETLMPQGK